ncbi:MAG: response regulator [Polyangiaceae bacterium]
MSTILAVDDSATMRKCLEITFAGTEFNVVAVESAQDALEKVKTLKPDLVIADTSLPPNDGYELCSTIKLAAPSLPVLMLASKQHPFDAQKGAQADGHIDKPFDTQVLQDRARELVQTTDKSDTDVPGAPDRPQKVVVPDQRATPQSSKIPAPRRKRPTPAMMTNPLKSQPVAGVKAASATASAAMRRTVPFAMPGSAKRGAAPAAVAEALKKASEKSTQPLTPKPAAAGLAAPAPVKKPTGDTLPGVPQPPDGVAVLPEGVAADLETKLTALGLTKEQMEGVLALSREVVEQVVWEVVPTLAEVLIKEEIRRLTKD